MKIGIGLPAMVSDRTGRDVVAWSVAAEQAQFSSLAVGDVLTDDNFEPLTTLAAAAAVTERIGLLTSILLASLHANSALLAKQAATLDQLSGGRLTLGIGVGLRPDDFAASELPFASRGAVLDERLELLERHWSGRSAPPLAYVGPPPLQAGGPPLLLAASSEAGIRRLQRHGSGFVVAFGSPSRFEGLAQLAQAAWDAGARASEPRNAGLAHFALGDSAEDDIAAYVRAHERAFGGNAEWFRSTAVATPAEVRELCVGYAEAGCQELIFLPCSARPDQVARLAEAAQPAGEAVPATA